MVESSFGARPNLADSSVFLRERLAWGDVEKSVSSRFQALPLVSKICGGCDKKKRACSSGVSETNPQS
jgi:hypothetical protein